MTRRQRTLTFAAVILLVLAVKGAQELFRWVAYGEERTEIGKLEMELEHAALGVISTQMAADTLRRFIEAADTELGQGRDLLDSLEGRPGGRRVGPGGQTTYRRELTRYNEQVVLRNKKVEAWREVLDGNHLEVDRYNTLADSIRTLADRMGELYYPVRTPAEIAASRGIVAERSQPVSAAATAGSAAIERAQ